MTDSWKKVSHSDEDCYCSFCQRNINEVPLMLTIEEINICEECNEVIQEVFESHKAAKKETLLN